MHPRLNLAWRPGGWLRACAVTLAALVLIGAHAATVAVLLAHSYFRQDDFLILDRAAAPTTGCWPAWSPASL